MACVWKNYIAVGTTPHLRKGVEWLLIKYITRTSPFLLFDKCHHHLTQDRASYGLPVYASLFCN